MGWLRDAWDSAKSWVKEKVDKAVDWVKEKLSRKKYDEDDVEDEGESLLHSVGKDDVVAVLERVAQHVETQAEESVAKGDESQAVQHAVEAGLG